MVIKIALCDTNREVCKLYVSLLKNYTMAQPNDTDYKLVYFNSSQELLAASFDYDVLFLETELEQDKNGNITSGIETGKILRKMGNRAVFIIVSSNTGGYACGYSATVFRYILKPLDQQKFGTTMRELLDFWQNDNRILAISHNKQTDYIPVNDIIMIENYMKKRMIHTGTQVFYVKESWQSLENKLHNDGRFFKPQRGFLINLAHVQSNNKAALTMKNGTVIPFKRGSYDVYCKRMDAYLNRFR